MVEDLDLEEEWCTQCAYKPCLCILTKLEMKINFLKKIEEKEKNDNSKPAGIFEGGGVPLINKVNHNTGGKKAIQAPPTPK